MQPPKCEGWNRQRVIVLDEPTRNAESLEDGFRINFGEPSTGIGMAPGGDKLYWRGHAAPLASLPA